MWEVPVARAPGAFGLDGARQRGMNARARKPGLIRHLRIVGDSAMILILREGPSSLIAGVASL
jgi:hypothetical protein